MDSSRLSKLANYNDNGVTGMYPIPQLSITKIDLSQSEFAILRVGVEIPSYFQILFKEVVLLEMTGQQMLFSERAISVKRWRTWAEFEEINSAVRAKLEDLLQCDAYKLPIGMTLRDLKGSTSPAHKRLFKKIKKAMKAWCVKKKHCFKFPVPFLLMLMRNCPMHADQNMARQLLVLALKTAFEIDCVSGNAKPLQDDDSAISCCLTSLRDNYYGLIRIEKRSSEILEKQGSAMSFGDFTFRFKGQNVCEFLTFKALFSEE